VVIWKTKNVPPMDSLEKMSDLFVKCWPEGCTVQETDTHWRCKKGKASFNWRMLFDVELGPNTKAMKFPYLHLQLWDRDILKWNDCAGEGTINLGKYFRKAYKRNVAIKMFENTQGAMAVRAKKQQQIRKRADLMDTEEDIPPAEPSTEVVAGVSSPPASGEANKIAPSATGDKGTTEVDDEDEDTGLGAIPVSGNTLTKKQSFKTVPSTDPSDSKASKAKKDGSAAAAPKKALPGFGRRKKKKTTKMMIKLRSHC